MFCKDLFSMLQYHQPKTHLFSHFQWYSLLTGPFPNMSQVVSCLPFLHFREIVQPQNDDAVLKEFVSRKKQKYYARLTSWPSLEIFKIMQWVGITTVHSILAARCSSVYWKGMRFIIRSSNKKWFICKVNKWQKHKHAKLLTKFVITTSWEALHGDPIWQ